tara:strand:+ start:128 stop:421 length:294 start_codon:yes stop_codon:yes gene_type:complete
MKIDHVAIIVDDPEAAAKWYIEKFGAELIYADSTWAFIEFENVKLAFVVKGQHPTHLAFETTQFAEDDRVKKHRDGSESVYRRDPWGNFYELIRYNE